MAHRGIPKLASPQAAQRILARLQKLSAPLGTTVSIEGNIGVIRTRPTTSQGAN
jgi:poly-gamma-glutamate synthesis protein (capsule biosynthesis protein)